MDGRDYGPTWNQALEAGGVLVGNDVRITRDIQDVPLDVDDLIAEAGGSAFDGLPRQTAVGHVHLHVGMNTWAGEAPSTGPDDAGLMSWTLLVPEEEDAEQLSRKSRGCRRERAEGGTPRGRCYAGPLGHGRGMEPIFFDSRQHFRNWLEENHDTWEELWVGSQKEDVEEPGIQVSGTRHAGWRTITRSPKSWRKPRRGLAPHGITSSSSRTRRQACL